LINIYSLALLGLCVICSSSPATACTHKTAATTKRTVSRVNPPKDVVIIKMSATRERLEQSSSIGAAPGGQSTGQVVEEMPPQMEVHVAAKQPAAKDQ